MRGSSWHIFYSSTDCTVETKYEKAAHKNNPAARQFLPKNQIIKIAESHETNLVPFIWFQLELAFFPGPPAGSATDRTTADTLDGNGEKKEGGQKQICHRHN